MSDKTPSGATTPPAETAGEGAEQKLFNERDLKLLDTFAAHATEAIENAREKDRLKKQVRTLTAVQRDQSLREHGDDA